MSHPSEIITRTVKEILVNGNTLAGDRIYIDQMIHPDDVCLPQAIIYTNSEDITLIDQAPKRQRRSMNMIIEVLMQQATEPEVSNRLKQLVWQIEVLLADDDDWNETVNRQNLTSERYEFRESGTYPIGHCLMTYDVEYITELPASIELQQSANLTDLDALQGLSSNGFGIDLVGDPGAPQPGDPNNEVEAEILIETP